MIVMERCPVGRQDLLFLRRCHLRILNGDYNKAFRAEQAGACLPVGVSSRNSQ
jgi:hypothetical protein